MPYEQTPSPGDGGAPENASYILIAQDAALPQGRTFTPGPGLSMVDAGPGGLLTVDVSHTIDTQSIALRELTSGYLTQVTYAAAAADVVCPDSIVTWPVGVSRWLRKSNTSAFPINLTPNAAGTLNGGSVGVGIEILGSRAASSSTSPDLLWLITRDATNAWRISSCQMPGQLSTVATATGTLGSASITEVTYAAALCALTLPSSQALWPIGASRWIRKSNTSVFQITLAPNSGGTINGAAANAVMTLNGSATPSSTTTSDQGWLVTRDAASTWRVSLGRAIAGYDPTGIRALVTATFACTAADIVIPISTAAGAVLATLPDPAQFIGRAVLYKKTTTDANTISAVPFGSELIDDVAGNYLCPGSASAMKLAFGFVSNGTNWRVI